MNNNIKIVAAVLIFSVAMQGCLKSKDDVVSPPSPITPPAIVSYNWAAIADSAQQGTNYFYNISGQYFITTNNSSAWAQYWPTAHGLDVWLDAYLRNPTPAAKARMDNALAGLKAKNGNTFINFYYDDMEWLALACLRIFKATNDVQYKNTALLLWADIKNGWSADLGGGIWWRKDNSSKNAPSNLPACILASRLYKMFNDPNDLVWAKQIYQWQKSVLYDDASGLVYDNIEANGNKNTIWKFTYNQGTFIGAAQELYSITNNTLYINDALKAADYTLLSGQLTDIANGVLKNEGGGDGGLFKGIFVRYLNRFIIDGNIDTSKKIQYINFLKSNAQKLWSNGTNKSQVLFGTNWMVNPGGNTDFTTQLSGVMLFEALAELKSLNLID